MKKETESAINTLKFHPDGIHNNSFTKFLLANYK